MKRLAILALAFAAAAAPAAAEHIDGADMRHHRWVRTPSPEEIQSAYPRIADQKSATGKAVIGCKVAEKGRLSDCKVVSETPAEFGFGPAALKLAPKFRLSASDEGATITIPIVFRR